MDLFGRKARAQLDLLVYWLAEKDGRIQALETSSQAKDRIIEKLRDHIFRLEAEAVTRSVVRPSAPIPPMREEEEELRYALSNGDINQSDFERLLEQVGFENTEVEIPTRPERPIVY
jgi:hypothetical protein